MLHCSPSFLRFGRFRLGRFSLAAARCLGDFRLIASRLGRFSLAAARCRHFRRIASRLRRFSFLAAALCLGHFCLIASRLGRGCWSSIITMLGPVIPSRLRLGCFNLRRICRVSSQHLLSSSWRGLGWTCFRNRKSRQSGNRFCLSSRVCSFLVYIYIIK